MAIPPWQLLLGFLATSVAYSLLSSIYNRIQNYRKAAAKGCQPLNKIPNGFLGMGYGNYKTLIEYSSKNRSLDLIYKWAREYGYTYEQVVLGTKAIVTAEPENIKAILATQFNDFSLGLRRGIFGPFLGDGIFTLDGAGWSHSRAMLRPQFSRDQVADVAMLGDHVDQLIALMPADGTPFDIQEYFFKMTLDTATEFLFGESTNCLLEGGSNNQQKKTTSSALSTIGGEEGFADAFNKSQDYVVQRARAQNWYWLVNSAEGRRDVQRVHNVVDYYVDAALARYNQAGGDQEKFIESSNPDRYVFLDAMVAQTQDRRALRDQMLNILLAGRDTTASLLSSSFYYLARHPQVWQRLREEILAIFPPGDSADSITIARLREVRYLKHFLNEVLRLLPPVPANSRFATVDTTLPVGGGADGRSPVFVPKGTRVGYNVTVMHRRKDFWGQDAEEFRPERWEENGRHGWEYLPFNGGPRICLGQQYALTEASYVLVRLLQRFDHVTNGQPEMTNPCMKLSLTAYHALGVKVGLCANAE